MLILSNVLALALIVADEPRPAQAAPITITGHLTGTFTPQEAWPMTLPEAIRIGLDNSEVVRVITYRGLVTPLTANCFGPTSEKVKPVVSMPPDGFDIVIAPLNADTSIWNFKSAIMAHVRSTEQQYWALSQLQVAHWARETAVKLGDEILARERAELAAGRGTAANVAEADHQLDNFKLNLVTATSDLITTERQLRNILGLPVSDNRRIVPSTAPGQAKVEPVWEASLATMNASQPDIAQQRQLVSLADFKAIIEADNPTLSAEQREASKRRLQKQQEFLDQILHQTTHSLARFFLEVEANYKQYQTALKLRESALKRLELQRESHQNGLVTVDRLLDAVSQYANAIAQESLYLTTYNTSIAALEEAKGTLLTCKRIAVAEKASPRKATVQAKDDRVAPAAFEAPAPAAAPAPVAPALLQVPSVPTTYKLRARFGGLKVLELEVEVNPSSPPTTPASPPR